MRLLLGIIAALFAAVGVAWLLIKDPGYVLITAGPFSIEASLVVFVVFLVIAYFVLSLLFRYLMRLWRAPRTIKKAVDDYQTRKSQRLLNRGMQQMVEGRWDAAEVAFSKSMANSQAPTLNYIGAAQAAQRLNESMRRDSYLRKAEGVPERDALAVSLVRAEILIEDGKLTEARDLLERMHRKHSSNGRTLALLAQTYRDLGQWSELRAIMPQVQRYKALDAAQLHELQREMYRELFSLASGRGALGDLHSLWGEVPEALRSDEALLIDYVGHLRDNNAAGEAETLLRQAIQNQWSERLVVGYGEIARGDAVAQLQAAQGWLGQHAQDPYLLLTLGRLAKRCRQHDKARGYLEQSIKAMPSPDAYQELGDLLEQLDDKEMANRCYRAGLRLASGQVEAKEGVELLPSVAGTGETGSAVTAAGNAPAVPVPEKAVTGEQTAKSSG